MWHYLEENRHIGPYNITGINRSESQVMICTKEDFNSLKMKFCWKQSDSAIRSIHFLVFFFFQERFLWWVRNPLKAGLSPTGKRDKNKNNTVQGFVLKHPVDFLASVMMSGTGCSNNTSYLITLLLLLNRFCILTHQ